MSSDDLSARLRTALTRLSALDDAWITTADGKTARDLGAGDPVAAFLAEVADTVMPSKVTITSGAAFVAFAVAGRRVQGLLGASADLLAGQEALVDQVISGEDTGTAQALGSVLHALAQVEGPFALRSETAPRLGAEAEPGLTPEHLSELWDTAVQSTAPTSDLAQFLQDAAGNIRGGILTKDGDITFAVGDETLADPLMDVLQAAWPEFQSERDRISKDHRDPSLTCWQQSGGPVVAVASWPEGGIAALAFLPDELANILSIWSKGLAA